MNNHERPEPREIELVRQSYQPSKAERAGGVLRISRNWIGNSARAAVSGCR